MGVAHALVEMSRLFFWNLINCLVSNHREDLSCLSQQVDKLWFNRPQKSDMPNRVYRSDNPIGSHLDDRTASVLTQFLDKIGFTLFLGSTGVTDHVDWTTDLYRID